MVGNHENPRDIKKNICPRLVVENFAVQSMQRKQLKKLVRILVFLCETFLWICFLFSSIVDRLGLVRYRPKFGWKASAEQWVVVLRISNILLSYSVDHCITLLLHNEPCDVFARGNREGGGEGKNLSWNLSHAMFPILSRGNARLVRCARGKKCLAKCVLNNLQSDLRYSRMHQCLDCFN